MPYDAQGRWIEENEWEQMMREQAAQRVQAFSQYNDAPPSLYPNQAAPYGSFPYADPTPSLWDSSPQRLRQDVPADPKYQGWDFNQEPIANTSAISSIQHLAATDPNLQGVTPMSMASTGLSPQAGAYEKTAHGIGTGIMDAFGIDTQQHMDNVGMINKLSQSDMLDVPTGWNNEMYAAGLKAQDFVQSGANPLLAMAGSYPYQGLTEAFRATVDPTISYEEAMRMAAVQGLGGMIGAAGGLPAFEGPIGELIDDTVEKNVLGITTPDVTPNMWDTSAVSSVSPALPSYGVATGLTKQEMLDAGWKESTTGGLFPWGPSEEQMQDPDRVADMEVDTQVDTFSTGFPTETVATGSGGGFRPGFGSQRDTYGVVTERTEPTREDIQAAINIDRFEDIPVAKPTKPAKKTSRTTKTKPTVTKVSETDEIAAMVREIEHRNAIRDQVTRDLANARDRGTPSHAEVQAAINAMMGNEFGGMLSVPEGGSMSAAEINAAGGMEFGGAGGMAGSGRGSSGRGGPGGRGR